MLGRRTTSLASFLTIRSVAQAPSFRVPRTSMATFTRSPSSTPAKRLRERSPSPINGQCASGSLFNGIQQNGSTLQDKEEAVLIKPRNKEEKLADKKRTNRLKTKRKERLRVLEKSGEEPIFYDVCDLLGLDKVNAMLAAGPEVEWAEKFQRRELITLQIERLSAHGDGLAIAPSGDWVVAVPQCLPGETVLARVYANERLYSKADLVEVVKGAPASTSHVVTRRDDLIGCKYFGTCAGCQYQMIDYNVQLELKRTVVSRAFQNYTNIPSELLPNILPTLPSPLQYQYRTKLTPHFELPRQFRALKGKGKVKISKEDDEEGAQVNIGFHKLGINEVLDIEECPIATKTINSSLPVVKEKIRNTIHTFKNGATLLFRDSLCSFDSQAEDRTIEQDADTETITDHKAVVKERVGDVKFDTPAGAFFQNNRSILPSLLGYVEKQIDEFTDRDQDNYLVDAYCGSGLFSICLAKKFKQVAGIEISQDSIRFAKQNVVLNDIDNVNFLAGDAQEIFKVRFERRD